jgi:hypothetical protein
MTLNFRPPPNFDRNAETKDFVTGVGQQMNQFGDTLLQGAQFRQQRERQAMLDQLLRQREGREQQEFGMKQQAFAAEHGTPIDPSATFTPTAKLFTNTPGGRQTRDVQVGDPMPLRAAFDKWSSMGRPRAGARPEFMGALGKDERKAYQDQNSPEAQADLRLKGAQAKYWESRPAASAKGSIYFVKPSTGEMFDESMRPIQSAPPNGTPRIISDPGQSTEGSKRSGLVKGARNSISIARKLLTPGVLNEIKGIKMTPGNIYSQLSSKESKKLYRHLSNAIYNESYIKSGATLTPDEIEKKMIMYMPAFNDDMDDAYDRFDMLDGEVQNFDMSGGFSDPAPEIENPNPTNSGGLTPEEEQELQMLEQKYGGLQ